MSKNFFIRFSFSENPFFNWGSKVNFSSSLSKKKRDIFSGFTLLLQTFSSKPEVYISIPSINSMP